MTDADNLSRIDFLITVTIKGSFLKRQNYHLEVNATSDYVNWLHHEQDKVSTT